jgi:hypothetical protein
MAAMNDDRYYLRDGGGRTERDSRASEKSRPWRTGC